MKIIKYGSGSCGPCGRMAKFDERVVREEGLDYQYLKKKTPDYIKDKIKHQLSSPPANPQYVLVEDDVVKGTFIGATDPGTFRQRIRTLVEEKDGACCTSDDRSGKGKNCEYNGNNWVKDTYDSGGDNYTGTTHLLDGKLGATLSKDHCRGKRVSCGMTGGNSGCQVFYEICDKEDDKPDDECEKDGDCGDCEECKDGKCRDQCKDDEKCEDGKCVDKNPSPSPEPTPEPTPDPDECKNHDDCPDKCCDGVCQECCQDSHCVGGKCVDGVCVENEKPDPDPDLPDPPPPIDNGDGYDGPCPTTTINLFWDKKTNKYGAVYDDTKISDIAFVNAFDDEKRSLIITYKPYTCIPTCEDIGLCSTYTASGNTIVEFDGVTCEVNEEKRTLTLTFNGSWIDPDNWADPDEEPAEPESRWQQPVVYKNGGDLGGDPSGHCIDFDERECVPFRWDCKPENHTICQPEGNEKVEYTYKVSTHGCNARCGENGGGTKLDYIFYDSDGKELKQESGAGGNFKFTIDKDTPIGKHEFSVTATCEDFPDPSNREKQQNFWIKVEDCDKPPEPTPEPAPEPPSGAFYPQCFYLVCCPDCPPTPPAFEEGDNGDCDNRPEPDEVPGTNTRAKVYLYDRLNHTFIFCCPIKTDVTWLLPFDAIPPVFQRYITTMASVRAAAQMVDNPQLFQLLKDRENTLRMECMNYELEQGDLNYLGQPDYTTYVGYQPIQTLNR